MPQKFIQGSASVFFRLDKHHQYLNTVHANRQTSFVIASGLNHEKWTSKTILLGQSLNTQGKVYKEQQYKAIYQNTKDTPKMYVNVKNIKFIFP